MAPDLQYEMRKVCVLNQQISRHVDTTYFICCCLVGCLIGWFEGFVLFCFYGPRWYVWCVHTSAPMCGEQACLTTPAYVEIRGCCEDFLFISFPIFL